MALTAFTFENIVHIDDGVVAVAMDRALRAAFLDMTDRPEIDKERCIQLKLGLKPVMEKGHLRYAVVSFKVNDTLPAKSLEVKMNASRDGLEFSATQPHNPDQIDIPFPEEK